MACFLFTFHGYGTWLPDHPRGYVRRHEGMLPPDKAMAERYRDKMAQGAVRFDPAIQRLLIEETLIAGEHQQFRSHFIATETTHVHTLVSWRDDRRWQIVRSKMRESLTRRLNQEGKRQQWFSKSASRKPVHDEEHFEYLIREYLMRHSGLKWSEERGIFRDE